MGVKKQIRDAAIALFAGTGASHVGVYGAQVLDDDRLPALLVSVAIERSDEISTLDALGLIATLVVRVVGKAPLDIDDDDTVIDKLEAIEDQVHSLLEMPPGGDDPLDLGCSDVYLEAVDEPEVDDTHELPVAVLEVQYGIMLRVSRSDLTTII